VDRTRIKLGCGGAVFQAAKDALARWGHFRLGWVEAVPADTPIRAGEVVAVVARVLGLWWLNACRIVYVVDESGPVCRFGFAYGTLPGHAESGEERFMVEWDRASEAVWYDILAFSRPRHPLARLGYPLTRRAQKRFARASTAAMQKAVGPNGTDRVAVPAHRLTLVVVAGAFAVCRLPADAPLPPWATDGEFISITRTTDELSVVCQEGAVPDGVVCERGWQCLRVAGAMPFTLVGVLAALTRPIAAAGVGVFAVSTFDTDYLFFKAADFQSAVAALRGAGHSVAGVLP
jgi:uncharacterized protein (UPF0548 family)